MAYGAIGAVVAHELTVSYLDRLFVNGLLY